MRRLNALLSDAFWLYLFPALAIVMPWRTYFRLCRRMVHARHPYTAAIESELAFASRLLPALDQRRFREELALIKLVDAADFYLGLTRSHRWFRRHVDVKGAWPSPESASLLLGSHWGAAHWIWCDLRHRGHRAWFLARSSSSADFGRGRLAHWYGQFRGWGIRRAGARGVILTGGARARIASLLSDGQTLVALNDVPVADNRPGAEVHLFGVPARLPTTLIELARSEHAAIAWYAMHLDTETGRRTLEIVPLDGGQPLNDQAIILAYAGQLNEVLGKAPGAWQAWSLASALTR